MNCPACPSSQQSNSHTSSLHIGDGYWACSECSFGSISLKSALSHCFAEGHRPRGLRNRRRESISRFLAACEMLSSAHDPLRIRQMDSKRRAKTEADCSVVLSPPKNNSRKLLPETERKTKELNVRKTDHDVSVLSPTKTNSLEPRSISQETNWTTQTQFETNSLIAATPNNRTSPGPEWQQITEQNTREVDFSAVSLSPIKMDIPQHVQISKQMDWPRQTARETDLPFAAENDLQGLTEPETNRTRSDNTFLCSVLPRTEFEQENDEPSVSVDPLPLDSVLEMTVNTMGTKGSKNDETVNKMICPNEKRTSTRIRTLRQSGKERTNPDHVFGGMSEQEHAEIVAFLINETYPDHVVYKFNYRKKCRQFVLDRFSLDENPILLYISKKTDKTRKVLKIGDVQTIVQAIHVENRHCRYGALFTHVADRFYWPNTMHVDICAVLNNCDECGKSKTVSGEIQIEHITYSPEGALNERRKISKHQEVSNADVPVDLSDAADEEMDSEQKARSPETSLPFLDLSKTKQENCSNKLTEAEDVMDEMSRSYATVIAYNNTDRLSPISAPESTPQNPCSSQTDIPVPTKQSKKNGKQPSSVNSAKKKRKTLVPDHVYGGMSEQKYTEITNYLKNETYPEQVGVKSKFRQRCRHFSLDEQQRLENISNQKCKPRRVLKVGEVQGILETIHIENRHCGYGTLTNHITRRFWWPNSIQADTCAILNSCDVCKKLKKRVGLMEMEKLLSYE